ncbi:MAG: hypothetical protein RJA22_1289 [Verrucomicrobiota bacterium]
MSFLPIVQRELRVRARQPRTYSFRVWVALGAILFVHFLLAGSELMAGAANPGLGQAMFSILAWAAFVFCLLEGMRNTADCLSEEKRAGTLGLLFLTDLKGYDVVLGKAMATSLNSIYGLLAIFPPLGLPLLVGGVTAGEFWRLMLVLPGTLALSGAAGLLFSALNREAHRAWLGTALLVGGITVGPLLWNALPLGVDLPLGPACAFLALFDAAYQADPARFWLAWGTLVLLAVVLLTAASIVLPWAWQDRPRGAMAPRRGMRANQVNAAGRSGLLDSNPVAWLASGGGQPRFGPWVWVFGVCAACLWLWTGLRGSSVALGGLVAVFLLLHLGLSIWVASEACELLSGAREEGVLDLLLCTPLTVRDIVGGFRLGLRNVYRRPLILLVSAEGLLLAGYLGVALARGTLGRGDLLLAGGVVLAVASSVLDTMATARFGLWAGLSSSRHGVALGKTIGYVLLGPLLLGGWCLPLWPILALVKNVVFTAFAEDRLQQEFHARITERYAGGRPAGSGWIGLGGPPTGGAGACFGPRGS